MNVQPQTITPDQIGEVIAAKFKTKDEITCYVGSNAATPTASLEALTEAIQSGSLPLPFIIMVHLQNPKSKIRNQISLLSSDI
jgi:hypothetical protein